MSTRLMSQLSEKEFAQTVVVQRKKAYSTTIKGNSYMRSFMIFSRNKVKTMWEELDKKEPDDREGNNWLVYNGKYLHTLNIYEETDFNGFDKGTV